MEKRILTMYALALLSSFCSNVSAQNQHDYVWPFNYSLGNASPGVSVMDFNTLSGNPKIYHDESKVMLYRRACAPVADSFGNFLLSHNGRMMDDASGKAMENGYALGDWNLDDGLPEGGVVLPLTGKDNQYILVHETWTYIVGWGSAGYNIYYSIVDMTKNNGLGAVVLKKKLVFTDTLDYGKVSATRHANGRDWWIIIPKYDSNMYFTFLVTPDGLSYHGKQKAGKVNRAGLGQATFSPDGRHYAKYSTLGEVYGAYFDLYDFDRCTGQLSNHHQFFFSSGVLPGGVAFSPNSRILYVSYLDHMYQVDLNKQAYELKVVAEYDGYLSQPNSISLVPTYFGFMRLAPDGKIYCTPTTSGVKELHSIDKPDVLGPGCLVNQHSVKLPTLQQMMPNFPNYRLGPVDESPCDTLGIDNIPVAQFRFEPVEGQPLKVAFTDLSYFDPMHWEWEFDDGKVSNETNPEHLFASPGWYNVCLTVSNSNGENTRCKNINIGTSSQDDLMFQNEVRVFPNPFTNQLSIEATLAQNIDFRLYDCFGKLVLKEPLDERLTHLDTTETPPGIYFWQASDSYGKVVAVGKIVNAE